MKTELKVLIVDDSPVIRERMAALLADVERVIVVGQARGGREAIEMHNALRPDVMILDIHMPEVNGFEVLHTLQKQAPRVSGERALVIVLTNYSQSQYRDQAIRYGAQHFFDKSLEFGKVREVLQAMVTCRPSFSGRGVDSGLNTLFDSTNGENP